MCTGPVASVSPLEAAAACEARAAEKAAEHARTQLLAYTRLLGAREAETHLVQPVPHTESCVSCAKAVVRCVVEAPCAWVGFAVRFLTGVIPHACAYCFADHGDRRMVALKDTLSELSRHAPRSLRALQLVTDVGPALPLLRHLQVSLIGGGGVATCAASPAAGGGEWVWPAHLGGAHDGVPPALDAPFAERRLVLYVHGGGFALCNAATHRPLTANIARVTGAAVLATRYRRPPEHPFPAGLDDVVDVFTRLLDVVPAGRVVVAGDSAGANLAACLCLRARELGLPMPGGLVLISPWVDLSDTHTPSWDPARESDYLPPELATLFAEAYAGETALTHPLVSPLHAPSLAGLPRTLVISGAMEQLHAQQRAFARRLAEDGVQTELFVCPQGIHAFPMFADTVYGRWERPTASSQPDASRDAAGAPAPEPAEAPGAVRAFTHIRDLAHAVWGQAPAPPLTPGRMA